MTLFKSHQEMAVELGISRTTLWRRLTDYQIEIAKGLISPKKQHEIKTKLGFINDQTPVQMLKDRHETS